MSGFGYKTAWLAIRDGDADGAFDALGVRRLGPIGWAARVQLAARWAIRDGDRGVAFDALGVRRLGPVGCAAGGPLADEERDAVVATPPLPGAGGDRWLLVMGNWLATYLSGGPGRDII